ncbi:HAD family hydrolase [Flaviflexus sp.]|uniref:HAD family hydrolase n=1 Tax=Flaviflexus sp. TaxID=1969482 RepID=UPI003F91B67D
MTWLTLGRLRNIALTDLYTELGLKHAPAAILSDKDVTIVDTEPGWCPASIKVVEEAGGVWLPNEDPQRILGVSSKDHATALAQAVTRGTGEKADPQMLFDHVGNAIEARMRKGLVLMPGAGEVLSAFETAGLPQALVTASPKSLVQALVDGLGDHPLSTYVSGDDEIPGQPDPAPYLLGAERLGVDINDCLVFEDSDTGLAAARAAGATVHSVTERPLAELLVHLSE